MITIDLTILILTLITPLLMFCFALYLISARYLYCKYREELRLVLANYNEYVNVARFTFANVVFGSFYLFSVSNDKADIIRLQEAYRRIRHTLEPEDEKYIEYLLSNIADYDAKVVSKRRI